jgi:RNA polymerase sigma factor (sigma-70 family)
MAKYIPDGWVMSREGELRFNAMFARVMAIVSARARKYNLPGYSRADLIQDGLLAAAYAVDTYRPERGNLDGYISRVVMNSLAMVAAEKLAQQRQPHKEVQNEDGSWRKAPSNHVELTPDMIVVEGEPLDDEERGLRRERGVKAASLEQRIDELRLDPDARALLHLRLHTPPELWILARNVNGGRMRLETKSICLYLGWVKSGTEPDRARYTRVARDLRHKLRCILGVNEMTFEPLPPIQITDLAALQSGAKQRRIETPCS